MSLSVSRWMFLLKQRIHHESKTDDSESKSKSESDQINPTDMLRHAIRMFHGIKTGIINHSTRMEQQYE